MYFYIKFKTMTDLQIKTETRLEEFRSYICSKALQFGENLMPHDVVCMIKKADRSGKFKYILDRTYPLWKLELLIEVFESCGFEFPEEHKILTISNLQEYF